MRLLDQGAGVAAALAARSSGRVVARYRRAAYVQLSDWLVGFTDATAPRGPLHARLTVLPPEVLSVGSRIEVQADRLDLDGVEILRLTEHWEPALLDPEALLQNAFDLTSGTEPDLTLDTVGTEAGSANAARLGQVGQWLRARELARAAPALAGRGAGLTPAGDDVLAGIVLVTRLLDGAAAEEGLRALVAGCDTNRIALAFLDWAARGQSIEPAHLLLLGVARSDPTAILAARAELSTYGHSSGRDLAFGMAMALHGRALAEQYGPAARGRIDAEARR